MGCDNCERIDRLEREVREIRAKMTDERKSADDALITKIRTVMRVQPAIARFLAAITVRAGSPVTYDDLFDAVSPQSDPASRWREQGIRVIANKARVALRDAKINARVVTLYKTGYTISTADAAKIMAAL